MKYVEEYRDVEAGGSPLPIPRGETDHRIPPMEFCGGHTHALCRYGLMDLLPAKSRWSTAPAARCACCPSAASTRRSRLRKPTA